jgi:O-antigen biosynthesis protein
MISKAPGGKPGNHDFRGRAYVPVRVDMAFGQRESLDFVHRGGAVEAPESPEKSLFQGRVQTAGKVFARGSQRLRLCGVTYGPFAAGDDGQPFPSSPIVRKDFACMRAAGLTAIRTYHVPPERILRLADEAGLNILTGLPWIDMPWRQHFGFLESEQVRRQARQFVHQAAQHARNHPSLFAYCIANEIPSDILRWHGVRRAERFLRELSDVVKQTDPASLVTYANYPPTEYLELEFLDFVTFNVYLHDRETFRRYLFRLQNLAGDKPLVLGELGMDTLRHGESEQAEFLAGHLREAILTGLAGAFVFSWTDDWHTGGCSIEDWAFGITRGDRSPKASYDVVRTLCSTAPANLLQAAPRVSVVVCSYNGGRTLEQCLHSLCALDYPDYEVIVVDDGSTDNTREILERFPAVRAIHQPNQGLSRARNVGLHAATGSVIAYTDSDCFADPDWLTHLVDQLQRSGAAAVGGPNLTPEDGRLAACVAASPGQPVHVLESDQVAEHIPGCNMAFRRDALLAIQGFDPQYKKAGDDVDVCWRLRQAGHWISFAPGAFVWHHRRQTPRTYLRQQAGYGEAEALLLFKHPDRFNGRGESKWHGILYGASLQGVRLTQAIIYRGTFATGLFQCVYQPAPAHWAMLPSTLEWHAATALIGMAGFLWPGAWIAMAGMWALSLAVAVLQAAQARLPQKYDGALSRLLIAALCYFQPLVRSWARYRTRLFRYRPPCAEPALVNGRRLRLPVTGRLTVAYWTGEGYERTELLGLVVAYLNEHGWGKQLDSGWEAWDLEVWCHPWSVLQICTAQETHEQGKRQIRVRYRLRASGYTKSVAAAALGCLAAAIVAQDWTGVTAAALLACFCAGVWWRGCYRAGQTVAIFDAMAASLNLCPCALVVGQPKALTVRHRRRSKRWAAEVIALLRPARIGLRRLWLRFGAKLPAVATASGQVCAEEAHGDRSK